MIRNVIFDIGNVLAGFDYRSYLQSLKLPGEEESVVCRAVFEGPYWKEIDRGVWAEEEICRKCAELAPEYRDTVEKIFREGLEALVKEYPFSESWLKNLKERGYSVYLLSNYGERGFAWAERNFRFFRYVDGMVISYREKMIKPEPGIYRCILDRYDLKPEETVFLDDTLQNIQAAERAGIQGIHVTGHEAAARELEEHLVREN